MNKNHNENESGYAQVFNAITAVANALTRPFRKSTSLLLVIATSLLLIAAPASGAVYIVNAGGDGGDPVPGDGVCDNGFGGWKGKAVMSDPDWPYEIRLSSSDARFFQLYSPAAGSIFVAEPVTHANAALNAPEEEWPVLGLRVLDPSEAMSLTMRLDVIPR